MADAVFSRRALNRALLARQLLLRRHDLEPQVAVEHLIGLQSQAPEPPYWALWARLGGFEPTALAGLLVDRRVVRLAMMRSTLFLVSSRDAVGLRPLLQPGLERALRGVIGPTLVGLEQAAVAAEVRSLVESEPRTLDELGRALVGRWPSFAPADLARVARTVVALVQVPPRGLWQTGGPARHTSLEQWVLPPPDAAAPPGPDLDQLVVRYLTAFGPASVADVQTWSGLTRLGAVVDRLRPGLVCGRDEHGVELFDVPEAPRPGPDVDAPVRLLGGFDNVLLSHVDRSRVLGDLDHRRVMTSNGLVRPVVLVDGFVAGTWRIDRVSPGRARATLTLLVGLARARRAALEAEAGAALALAEPDREPEVRVEPV